MFIPVKISFVALKMEWRKEHVSKRKESLYFCNMLSLEEDKKMREFHGPSDASSFRVRGKRDKRLITFW